MSRAVILYQFVGKHQVVGVTLDANGGNLPAEHGPWNFMTKLVADRDPTRLAGKNALLAAVDRRGYFLWPDPPCEPLANGHRLRR
ncbi:hypothetical protein [Chelatococcus reniformis]|uniref:Uncharacterized protein n=1 Tax=Chelatococcus reniformis TaxID=1494448 RepID=A0A916UFZ8_9HYPH|nr:hypothetical protein [Chelatococcus reniformis]GGC71046.1 hypothetical protein GCM10010994_31970 [Chelatococcus reniformis]